MRHITLITGGCRSGKSAHALHLATGAGPRLFVATCPALDGEMTRRIARHQAERAGTGWTTVEEETDLLGVLARHAEVPLILVDCLTLWVNNLIYHGGDDGPTEDTMIALAHDLVTLCRAQEGRLILVTNETGMGVMPASPLARRFCDLAGRLNSETARAAQRVICMISGIAMTLKDEPQN